MEILKKVSKALLVSFLVFGMGSFSVSAQQKTSKEDYQSKYNLLVSRLGAAGVGIETHLDKWEADYPNDYDLFIARFAYYFTKSRSSQTITLTKSKYLGKDPLISLKDTLGVPYNYFEDFVYDDELFGQAISSIDKAIQIEPNSLDTRLIKSAAYLEYEKESPDMTLSFLKGLVDYNFQSHPKWTYEDSDNVSDDYFYALIQDYCAAFYQLGTPQGWEAFKGLSEKMIQYSSKNVTFLDNIGSYYLAYRKDYKTALKYYNQVLKIKPDDITAIKNSVLLARRQNDVKLEKKYLQMLVKYSEDEAEKASAQTRLSSLK